MKKIWFIRHGESMANAGHATADPAAITLTDRGFKQAAELARDLDVKPDLFVTSPYLRTQQTAAPALSKFPEVPVEVWPLQEYNYLSISQCAHTTFEERRPWVRQYWSKCDPDFTAGDGAESFIAFSHRVMGGIRVLQERDEKFIVLFVHGQVMRLVWQYLASGYKEPEMKIFRDKMLDFDVANTAIFKCGYKEGHWHIHDPFLTL